MSDEASSDSKDLSTAVDDVKETNASIVESGDEAPTTNTESGSRRSLFWMSTAIVLLAVIGLAVGGGWLWRQFGDTQTALARLQSETAVRIEAVQGSVTTLGDRYAEMDDRLQARQREVDAFGLQLDALPGALAELRRRVDAVQGGSFDSRANWLRAEAEYYLVLANTELQLAGRWENTAVALRLADDRLRGVADPAFAPVRALIADELIAVQSVRIADIEGLAFSLGRLAERAEQLPLRANSPASYRNDDDADDEAVEPGLGRLWSSTKSAFSSIISVERREESVSTALTAAEKTLVRRQLAVELQLARIALLRARQENFDISISNAQTILERDFDVSASEVETAAVLLEEFRQVTLAAPLPDISGSLSALRALAAGDE